MGTHFAFPLSTWQFSTELPDPALIDISHNALAHLIGIQIE
jgi:hypothetical protein